MRPIIHAAVLALTVSLAAAAGAEPTVRIASGIPGGTYRDIYAENLAKELTGHQVVQRDTSGSDENFELLVSGEAEIAFVQADIYASRLQEEPYLREGLAILGKLGDECIYIAGRKKGPVDSVRALGEPVGDRPARIAVGPEASGMNGSWDYLVTLQPALSEASIVHAEGLRALELLARGDVDAVAWVTDPKNLEHKMLVNLHKNNALQLMPLDDSAFSGTTPDGARVYESKNVTTSKGVVRSKKLMTVCTTALVVGRSDRTPELVAQATKLLSEHGDRIAGNR
jgi:TRAP-type uncharacterized transport system substrate-binding protein